MALEQPAEKDLTGQINIFLKVIFVYADWLIFHNFRLIWLDLNSCIFILLTMLFYFTAFF